MIGFTMGSSSAYLGAEPCVGANTATSSDVARRGEAQATDQSSEGIGNHIANRLSNDSP
jgi:hypothetical protein